MTTHLSQFGRADSLLTIDLDAITHNWRALDGCQPATETAAVVKADGYGLGAQVIAPPLAKAGCRTFFVMSLAEAVWLRTALAEAGHAHRTSTPDGIHAGQEDDYTAHNITPVINSIEQFQRLRRLATGPAHL